MRVVAIAAPFEIAPKGASVGCAGPSRVAIEQFVLRNRTGRTAGFLHLVGCRKSRGFTRIRNRGFRRDRATPAAAARLAMRFSASSFEINRRSSTRQARVHARNEAPPDHHAEARSVVTHRRPPVCSRTERCLQTAVTPSTCDRWSSILPFWTNLRAEYAFQFPWTNAGQHGFRFHDDEPGSPAGEELGQDDPKGSIPVPQLRPLRNASENG